MLSIHDILGNGGLAARRLDYYEERREQLAMAEAVRDAFNDHHHAVIEAGTGVGKSFAYLVPAILHIAESENHLLPSPEESDEENPDPISFSAEELERFLVESEENEEASDSFERKRVVISTHTIALQEQLFQKDIPFLHSILPFEFTSVLVKGRGNYLCKRRFHLVLKKKLTLFDDEESEELEKIRAWSQTTSDGSLSDMATQPNNTLWREIACEQGNCLGRHCKYFSQCFYQQARRRVENASLLIVNHALLFCDLSVRRMGGEILPNYDILIFDEAHTLEQAAGDHLGLSINLGSIHYLLNRLCHERSGKGLLSDGMFPEAIRAVNRCRREAEALFLEMDRWLDERPNSNGRVREPQFDGLEFIGALTSLSMKLYDACDKIESPEIRPELVATRKKIMSLAGNIKIWLEQSDSEYVYWLERSNTKYGSRITMEAAPLEVGPILRQQLFARVPSVILTSATLTLNGKGSSRGSSRDGFHFFLTRAGLADRQIAEDETANCFDVATLQVGSPFNYRKQATLVLAEGLPDPGERSADSPELFYEAIQRYIKESDGGAFVLFTSYSLLKKSADYLRSWFEEENYPFFSQADGLTRTKMIEQFRLSKRSVLFGTDSFWQGVDVQGETLRNVIITRLPFTVPTQPLTEARSDAITLQGGNAFFGYQLPLAILKFKQGFGRLIRSGEDRGMAVILDPRIKSKSYGRQFLASLPDCKLRVDRL